MKETGRAIFPLLTQISETEEKTGNHVSSTHKKMVILRSRRWTPIVYYSGYQEQVLPLSPFTSSESPSEWAFPSLLSAPSDGASSPGHRQLDVVLFLPQAALL